MGPKYLKLSASNRLLWFIQDGLHAVFQFLGIIPGMGRYLVDFPEQMPDLALQFVVGAGCGDIDQIFL